jgi:F0F1-type ATP synthase assembly protein I
VVRNDDGRSPLSVGLEWSARITAIGFEIAVPTLVGWWLDQRFRGDGWILLGGALLGVAVGILHLIQMAVALTKDQNRPDGSSKPDEPVNP